MTNLAQVILITLGVAVGSGVGTTIAVKVALPEKPSPVAATAQPDGAPAAEQTVADENGPSAADYLAVSMACSDLSRFGKTEDEAMKRAGSRARFLALAVKSAGLKFEDCQ